MKSGITILNHNTGFRNMKKDLAQRYGKEMAEQVWRKAGANLEELCQEYAQLLL